MRQLKPVHPFREKAYSIRRGPPVLYISGSSRYGSSLFLLTDRLYLCSMLLHQLQITLCKHILLFNQHVFFSATFICVFLYLFVFFFHFSSSLSFRSHLFLLSLSFLSLHSSLALFPSIHPFHFFPFLLCCLFYFPSLLSSSVSFIISYIPSFFSTFISLSRFCSLFFLFSRPFFLVCFSYFFLSVCLIRSSSNVT